MLHIQAVLAPDHSNAKLLVDGQPPVNVFDVSDPIQVEYVSRLASEYRSVASLFDPFEQVSPPNRWSTEFFWDNGPYGAICLAELPHIPYELPYVFFDQPHIDPLIPYFNAGGARELAGLLDEIVRLSLPSLFSFEEPAPQLVAVL